MTKTYDVAIVGAGPGGSAAAHYCAQSGLDVLLLDKADFPRDKTCGDGLTPRALKILEDMGIFDQASQSGFQINGLELHARSGAKIFAPIPEHSEYPNHLLVVPRLKLDDIIRRRAIKSGAHFESPVRVRNIEHEDSFVRILAHKAKQKQSYKAKVVIIAIGANIRLLQELDLLNHSPTMIMAARVYFENVANLTNNLQIHFSDVPIPGYGWIFPTSKDSANIGIGYWPKRFGKNKPSSPSVELKKFLSSLANSNILANSQMQGKIKGYPLRIDFNKSKTYSERILLIGESIGLVSPLTGEGIDFALQTGNIAAEFILANIEKNIFSEKMLINYDQILRDKFSALFKALERINQVFFNQSLLDKVLYASESRENIRKAISDAMMASGNPAEMLTLRTLFQVILS